jgi:hypothetical protein
MWKRANGLLTRVGSPRLTIATNHTVVEQYRLLDSMIQIIKVIDEKTGLPVCNPEVCPTMSASGYVVFETKNTLTL